MGKLIWPWMESDRSVSMRRCLAAFFAVLSSPLFYLAFKWSANGWYVFIPGIVCVIAALILLFFTTWAEITEMIKAVKGPGKNDTSGIPLN